MKEVWDTAVALCTIEGVALSLKKELCNGSMLKGYTAKPLADVDQAGVAHHLANLKKAVARFEELVNEEQVPCNKG